MADDESNADDKSKGEGTNNTSGDDSGAQGASEDVQKQGDDDASNAPTREEFEDLKRRMQAADKNKSEAEKRATDAESKLKDIERKDQSDLEKAQTDLKDALEANASLAAKLDKMALTNAFLSDNTYDWVDASDAMALLNREGVEVKDGEVTGLKPAIAALAKAKPHLLKPSDDDKSTNSSGASGSSTNGKRKGEGKDDKTDYSSRFPALKR